MKAVCAVASSFRVPSLLSLTLVIQPCCGQARHGTDEAAATVRQTFQLDVSRVKESKKRQEGSKPAPGVHGNRPLGELHTRVMGKSEGDGESEEELLLTSVSGRAP